MTATDAIIRLHHHEHELEHEADVLEERLVELGLEIERARFVTSIRGAHRMRAYDTAQQRHLLEVRAA